MKWLSVFSLVLLSVNLCFSEEKSKTNVQGIASDFINPCYQQQGKVLSGYYKFSFSEGQIIKYNSPEDKTGEKDESTFSNLKDFLDKASAKGGGKNGIAIIGVAPTDVFEQCRNENQTFHKIVGADFSDCDCLKEENCNSKKSDLLMSAPICVLNPSIKCSESNNDSRYFALRDFFISKCLNKSKPKVIYVDTNGKSKGGPR